MEDQLNRIDRRFQEVEGLLSTPEVLGVASEFRRLSKEHSTLAKGVELSRQYRQTKQEIEDAKSLLIDANSEMIAFVKEELVTLNERMEQLKKDIARELLPKDPNDYRNIILEVRAGAGGDEASLFSYQLFRAYSRYCEGRKWKIEMLSLSENELGGFKEVTALVTGEGVYGVMKHESGVHRVQRVPQTESQGRIHTSTITVAILPEAEDVEVSISDNDIRVDTYRASGAGGQHVNRTDSAVRLTHIPSGVVVTCQDERSQIKNKSKAMKILQAKLLEMAQMEQDKLHSDDRKSQVGRGDRSERIRTYNFPQSRVTDHRINFTTHAIDAMMEGSFDEILAMLKSNEEAELVKKQAQRID